MVRRDEGEPYWRISIDEANDMIGEDGVQVIDVRQPDEWIAGRVSGAVHIPVDEVLSRMGELESEKKLLFICAAGVRSGLACEMAAAMGVDPDRLYNIEDGTGPWIEKGYPTEYGA